MFTLRLYGSTQVALCEHLPLVLPHSDPTLPYLSQPPHTRKAVISPTLCAHSWCRPSKPPKCNACGGRWTMLGLFRLQLIQSIWG